MFNQNVLLDSTLRVICSIWQGGISASRDGNLSPNLPTIATLLLSSALSPKEHYPTTLTYFQIVCTSSTLKPCPICSYYLKHLPYEVLPSFKTQFSSHVHRKPSLSQLVRFTFFLTMFLYDCAGLKILVFLITHLEPGYI